MQTIFTALIQFLVDHDLMTLNKYAIFAKVTGNPIYHFRQNEILIKTLEDD